MKKKIILFVLLLLFFTATFKPLWQTFKSAEGNIQNEVLDRGIFNINLGMDFIKLSKSLGLKKYLKNETDTFSNYDSYLYTIPDPNSEINLLLLSFDRKSNKLDFIEAKYKAGEVSRNKYNEIVKKYKNIYGQPKKSREKSIVMETNVYLWRDPKTQFKIIHSQPSNLSVSYENNEHKLAVSLTPSDIIKTILLFLLFSSLLTFIIFGKESMRFAKLTPERYRDMFVFYHVLFVTSFIPLIPSEFNNIQKNGFLMIFFTVIIAIPISIISVQRQFKKINNNILFPNRKWKIPFIQILISIFIVVGLLIYFNQFENSYRYFLLVIIAWVPVEMIVTLIKINNFEKTHGILYFEKKPEVNNTE